MSRPMMPRLPRRAIAAALVISVMVTGCAYMAPSYERPEFAAPSDWPQASKGTLKAGATTATPEVRLPSATNWRAYFLDPRLQALIETALKNNRDLRISVARVEEARALYGIAHADRLPSVNLNASRSETQTPQTVLPQGVSGAEEVRIRRADANLGLLAFELDFWGRVASLSQAARASYLATEQAQRTFELSLIADIADADFAFRELAERVSLASQSVSARSESLMLIAKRRDFGLASDFDLLSAQGALEAARAELAALERAKSQAENVLRLLLGADVAVANEPASLSQAQMVAEIIPGLPAEVLLNRPDVLAAEQRLIAAKANIGAARAAFFPRIALTGSFGSASTSLSGLFEPNSTAWTFMPSISLPIFSGGRNVANLDLANARKIVAVAEYEKTIQQAFREVADALASLEALRTQTQALESLEKTQEKRLEIAQARYKAGIASLLEVLDAQRELVAAQQNRVAAQRLRLSARARLFKTLGGA
jgi:multidrug efflux system outer membrane protein